MAQSLDEAKKLMIEINSTVSNMDESVRGKAFDILAGIAFTGKVEPAPKSPAGGGAGGGGGGTSDSGGGAVDTDDLAEFVAQHETNKAADNVKVLFAYLFSQYGKVPFHLDDIRHLARDAGLTIPDRLDMTLRNGKADGRSLYQSKGNGKYQLTAHGETYMKNTYSVPKGKKTRPTESGE